MARKKGRRSKPFNLALKPETISSISAFLIVFFGLLIVLSFSRQGLVLTKIYEVGVGLLGWTLLFLPFVLISGGLFITKLNLAIAKSNVFLGGFISLLALTCLTQSGAVGVAVFDSVASLISSLGAGLFFLLGLFIGQVILWETSLEDISEKLNVFFNKAKQIEGKLPKAKNLKGLGSLLPNRKEPEFRGLIDQDNQTPAPEITAQTQVLSTVTGEEIIWEQPPLSLLSDTKAAKADRGDVNKNIETIEKTLRSFGIESAVAEVNLGPSVTQYAIEIATGIKLSKITNLSQDLALALSAPQGMIRIEAPIPGRNLVGIEVPNKSLETVNLKTMLTSENMRTSKSLLTVSLGLNVAGEPTVADISKMPHVLIAGATGSGKSVCVNAFITSILFRASPSEVKFIMVDPKRVELSSYNGIPHLLTPVIHDPEKVIAALGWATKEMDNRYKLLAEAGVRNIAGYNEQAGFPAMPYIVIIIDELADIMLFAPNEVESAVTRLAQMARAVGIHLVLATQRPSTDVITGLIKANIPTRIAFNVASMIDSRVILDTPGAEKLLGRGDMLYIPPDQAKPRRVQGAFVSEEEVKDLVNFLKKQGLNPEYKEEIIEVKAEAKPMGQNGEPLDELDPLFEEAVRSSVSYQKASSSLLQRRLSIGYSRAAKILDQLEATGVVGPADGSKPREVLISSAEEFFAKFRSQ